MLIIYTFVFSIVFKARWGGETFGGVGEFALLIFVGMIVQNFFAEVINRSPTLVLNNANYVKKVIFPIQIIPVIAVGAALFHAVISMIVFLFAMMIFNNGVGFNALYAPLIFLPFVLAGVFVFLANPSSIRQAVCRFPPALWKYERTCLFLQADFPMLVA
jgi:lipopolysaccharide transport system permease protein